MRRLLLFIVLACSLPLRAKLVENVASQVDPSQTYTLYLPSSWDASKRHPLLFVLDPRGRGTLGAEIFREAAEEQGWIVISANGTRSDESMEPNERALRAIYPEAARYGADPKRLYAAGFSGTAMVAWLMGINGGNLAGVIGVGGRLIEEVPPQKFSFAHFGFAGDADFNNREMRAIDAILEREGKMHRFESFAGRHQWISSELAREALRWLELVAMKENRRARDEAFIAREYERALAAPASRAALRTFEGLRDVEELRARVVQLERDPAVLRALKEQETWDAYEADYVAQTLSRIGAIFGALRQQDVADMPGRLARELRIAELQRHAKRPGAEGASARRLLEAVHAQLAFYTPRQFAERREDRFGVASITLATRIFPDRASTWNALADAYARLGDTRRAAEARKKAEQLK